MAAPAETTLSQDLQVDISELREDKYYNWIVESASRLRKELPFEGPADVTIVLGSGLNSVWEGLNLQDVRHIKDSKLGLPVGKTPGHEYEWIAGIAPNKKKILIKSGRVGAIEPDPMGTESKAGRLSNVDMATAYLRVLDEIGTDILITTHAAGGIAQPKKPGDRIPFPTVPQIALVTNHIDEAFINPLMGPRFDPRRPRFSSPKEQDKGLMDTFEEQVFVGNGGSPLEKVVYYTSNTSPGFEDTAYIHKVILNGGEAFGMSLGPEKRVIDDCININRFINLAIITNPVQLAYKGGNAELLETRRALETFGINLGTTESGMRPRELAELKSGRDIIPSTLDFSLSRVPSERLKKVFLADHDEVLEKGKMAISMLKNGIEGIIYGEPRVKYEQLYPGVN